MRRNKVCSALLGTIEITTEEGQDVSTTRISSSVLQGLLQQMRVGGGGVRGRGVITIDRMIISPSPCYSEHVNSLSFFLDPVDRSSA